MARKIKLPRPKKIRRNPMARQLATGKFRARLVPREGGYRRRGKHPKPATEEGE
jgi:hypothetical protein